MAWWLTIFGNILTGFGSQFCRSLTVWPGTRCPSPLSHRLSVKWEQSFTLSRKDVACGIPGPEEAWDTYLLVVSNTNPAGNDMFVFRLNWYPWSLSMRGRGRQSSRHQDDLSALDPGCLPFPGQFALVQMFRFWDMPKTYPRLQTWALTI